MQSPSVPVSELGKAIDQFLMEFVQQLKAMPKDEFERHRQAVLTGLHEKPKSLAEQSSRFWGSIDVRDYDFSRRKKLIDAVERLTHDDLSEMYDAMMVKSGYSLQIDSSDGAELSGEDLAEGRETYRLPSYKM